MKAAPFEYQLAQSLEHALEVLAQQGGEAKLIAGGQSLVPMMAMRLTRPSVLLDINRLAELKTITTAAQVLTMGAGVRQRTIEDDPTLDTSVPLLRQALRWVGHIQTRNRGTVGGSLVHADPSAELPLTALLLGAQLRIRSSKGGVRQMDVQDFFLGPMMTAVNEDECLTEIDWPIWSGGRVACAFEETAIRHGDFAMASAACQIQFDAQGKVLRAAMGLGGVSGTPLAFPELARKLIGLTLTKEFISEIAHTASQASDPGGDMHASGEFRQHLAGVLLSRVLTQAAAQAAP
jgi:CO/xanthine dehydrogenase FAD-binding subunit